MSNAPRRDRQRDAVGRWTEALGQGDHEEVERLVRRSRAIRVEDAGFGRLGRMVGSVDPTAPNRGLV